MGSVIPFPVSPSLAQLEQDPYYRFIRQVLSSADIYGLALPDSLNRATEQVYHHTRRDSRLARMLADRQTD